MTQNTGKLRWGGGHVFHDPSVSCVLRKGDDGPVLHATAMRDGESVESDLPLAERIKNKNGHLVFSMSHRFRICFRWVADFCR